jgi:hypothetical protein
MASPIEWSDALAAPGFDIEPAWKSELPLCFIVISVPFQTFRNRPSEASNASRFRLREDASRRRGLRDASRDRCPKEITPR